jgi:hypothetical protein
MRPKRKPSFLVPLLLSLLFVAIGCADSNRSKAQPTTRTSDAAIHDPFGKWSNVDTDISGGNTGNLDKNALQRDVDRVLLK